MLSLKMLITIALIAGLGATGLTTVPLAQGAATQLGSALNAASAHLGLQLNAMTGTQTQAQVNKNTVNAGTSAQTQTQATVKTKTNAQTKASVNTKTNANADNSLKVATAIANQFGVSVSDVTALHNSGWGYGEIVKLYEMAKASGKSVTDIEAMRASGKGWGEIAAMLNTSVSGLGYNLGAIMSGQVNVGHN